MAREVSFIRGGLALRGCRFARRPSTQCDARYKSPAVSNPCSARSTKISSFWNPPSASPRNCTTAAWPSKANPPTSSAPSVCSTNTTISSAKDTCSIAAKSRPSSASARTIPPRRRGKCSSTAARASSARKMSPRKAPTSAATWKTLSATTWSSPSAPAAPARPTSPSPWPSLRF